MMKPMLKQIDQRTREYKAGYHEGLKNGRQQAIAASSIVRGRAVCVLDEVIKALNGETLLQDVDKKEKHDDQQRR